MAHPWERSWTTIGALGEGGQGTTYLVERDGVKAVAKALRHQDKESARRRMFKEVGCLRILKDAGADVPEVIEDHTVHFEENTPLYFVMEHIAGRTLREFIDENGPVSLDVALKILRPIIATTQQGHTENILHRDIKPGNIVLRGDDPSSPVLIDYGLSFNAEDQEISVTETNEAIWNELVMLPEATTPGSNRRDVRSDVTQIGCLFYYLLTGENSGNLASPPHRRTNSGLSNLDGVATTTPLVGLFDRAFQLDPNNRFQSLDEFSERLEQVVAACESEAIPDVVQTALTLGEDLNRIDRKTVVERIRLDAQQKGHLCDKECGNVTTSLKNANAQVQFPRTGQTPEWKPVDLTPLWTGRAWILQVQHHGEQGKLQFCIGLEGLESCLVCRTWNGPSRPNAVPTDESRIAWWHENEELDQQVVADSLKKWLNDEMGSIRQRLIK